MSAIGCECEHIAHFEADWATPNGNPGHRYSTAFLPQAMKRMRTPYGTFVVCIDCAKDCHCDSIEELENVGYKGLGVK